MSEELKCKHPGRAIKYICINIPNLNNKTERREEAEMAALQETLKQELRAPFRREVLAISTKPPVFLAKMHPATMR